MIQLGEDRGCATVALITAMDRPLGQACGNALETAEAIATLNGGGPPDLREVTLAEGVEMLLVAGGCRGAHAARGSLRAGPRSRPRAAAFRSEAGPPRR